MDFFVEFIREFRRTLLELDERDLDILMRHFEEETRRATMHREETAPVVVDIRSNTLSNDDFRHTVTTGLHSQLVMMSLQHGETIGMETHSDVDQIIYIVKGDGYCVLDGIRYGIQSGYSIFIKAGVKHDIVNDGRRKMKLFTVYSPPEHPAGTTSHSKPSH